MPQVSLPDGRIVSIPGVYFTTKIATSSPGPVPAFLVPVILASTFEGHPYNVDSLLQTVETPMGPAIYFGTADAAGRYFGRGSDMHRAFVWAQRHGLPGAYCISLSAMTRASVVVDATSVNQLTLYPKAFGAPGGWIKIKFAANVLTVQNLKAYAFLRTNLSGTSTRVELKGDTSWIVPGGTYSIGDNSTAIGTITVRTKATEYDSLGLPFTVIETTAAFGSALTTALYGMVADYDVGREQVYTGITDAQKMIDAINNYKPSWLVAKKHAAFTNAVPDTVAAFLPIKQIATWITPLPGVSPAATSSDVTAFVSLMNVSAWEDFSKRYGRKPQAYLLAMSDSVSHGLMRDYAIQERTRGVPISVTTGPGWGDWVIASGTDTDPKFRTAALNSQDVSLWGPGLDREPPYLSLAAAVFGRRVSGGPGHNLTNDELLFTELEHKWDEINSGQLTTLVNAGFGTVKFSTGRTFRYRVCAGVSTLQSNVVTWNPTTKDTCLVMQRDLADFVNWVQQVDLEEDIVGADGVNASVIAAGLRLRAERTLLKQGYLATYTINLIAKNDSGNGYNVQQAYSLPTSNDIVSLENTILT